MKVITKNDIKGLGILAVLIIGFMLIPIKYTVYIEDIKKTHNWLAKAVLYIADSNDTVKLNIFSGGGSAHEGLKIVGLIENSPAHIISNNIGIAGSAAALIAMAADEQIGNPSAIYMFHRPYYIKMMGFNIIKVLVPVKSTFYIAIDTIMENHIKKYLTAQELSTYSTGADVTITYKDLKERMRSIK